MDLDDALVVDEVGNGRVGVFYADDDGEGRGDPIALFGDTRSRASWEEAQLFVAARTMLIALRHIARAGHAENDRNLARAAVQIAMKDVMPEDVS